jgi:hypothetical protein
VKTKFLFSGKLGKEFDRKAGVIRNMPDKAIFVVEL